MPGRLPNTFKGVPAGVNPKSMRQIRRTGPAPSSMPSFLRSRNPLKSRVIQSGVFYFAAGGVLLLTTIISNSQYGFAIRFRKAQVGLSLLNIMWIKAIVDLILGVYTGGIWYLSLILDSCFFNTYAFLAVSDSLISVWSVLIVISSLLFNGSTSANVSYSSGQRTLLVFLAIALIVLALLTVGYTLGCIQMWKTERWRQRHATADFSSVVAMRNGPKTNQQDSSDSSDSSDESSDEEQPRPVAPPVPAYALPTPGTVGAAPTYYKQEQPAAAAPVHDDTTRALFAHMWQSMQESGSFVCGVSRVPGIPELVAHLRTNGFLPLMTGDDGILRKVYFYSEENVQGNRVMVFLAEFKFEVAEKRLSATFKSHTKTHIQQVKKFNLQKLFQVVRT